MQTIDELIDYVEKGQASQWLEAVQEKLDRYRLRIVAIKLLGWLKSQNRMRKKGALALNMKYPWCKDLVTLVTEDLHLSSLFVTSEEGVDFRDDIDEVARKEIRISVDARHRPPLRISTKKK